MRAFTFARLVTLALAASPALACDSTSSDGDETSSPSGGTGSGAAPIESGDTGSDGPASGGSTSASGGQASGGFAGGGQASGGAASESGGGSDSGGSGGSTDTGGSGGNLDDASAAALLDLQEWLEGGPDARTSIESEDFAQVPLTQADATAAKNLLWDDRATQIRATRQAEVDAKSISSDDATLQYETVFLGVEPEGGRSLFISMHGGGSAPAATNDEQWQNQILLADSYAPTDALWIAPRAPTDDWNMWFKDHIVPLFDRLITNMIVFEGINPNKVYLTGYSAGGDGVYQLGPTLADRWAAAAMSAGHPNDMTPVNLRNIGFAIHVGGDDTAFDRNLVAAEWGTQLDDLQAADPEGYAHQVEVHAGLPHWMELADQPSIPYVQSFLRDPFPAKVVWKQSTLLQTRFYWLKIEPASALKDVVVAATVDEQTVSIESADLDALVLRLSDEMLDLDQPVTVELNGAPVFQGRVFRTIGALHATLREREDPQAIYSAELNVSAK